MFIYRNLTKVVSVLAVFILISACTDTEQLPNNGLLNATHLTVYKNAKCSCCGKWINHMKNNGFTITSNNQNSLFDIKEKYPIQQNLRSCHTSVSDEGFVFEGHIPAKFIQKFINEKPDGGKGLAVPAMPTGTPGMEFGDMLQPYKIYLLKTDGTTELYAEVNSVEEQL